MLLYKYLSFNVAQLIVNNPSIGFSSLEDLNDPFEGTGVNFEDGESLPSSVVANAVRNRMSRNFGVLSLTRTPLNPTMWSHYADDHRGVVIGIDINECDLNNTSTCVIPAMHGDIIYTSSVPTTKFPQISEEHLMEIGSQFSAYESSEYELFKRTFLYKALPWNYEEEVRVVKNIRHEKSSRFSNFEFENKSGSWNVVQFQGRPIYCLKIPNNAIKEVYLGTSTFRNVGRLGKTKMEYESFKLHCRSCGYKVMNVRQQKNSWQLEAYVHEGS